MTKNLKYRIAVIAGAIVFFLILAYGFVPQVLDGKVVNQSDISGYVGMAKEANDWDAAHPDDKTAWTNSMFGGMPTTMLNGNSEGDWTKPLYDLLLMGKRPASYLFISLVGAFLLMLAMGITPLLAVGGAVAVTFCSYNMQIIQVGHNAKMLALAFAPWVLAGVVYTYRRALDDRKKRWLPLTILGAALFAMALNFQIKANHVQISYYLAIIILCYILVLLVWLAASKERRHLFGRFFAASALLMVLGCAGIATNANRLIPTWLYTQETMRGGSELSSTDASDGGKSKGLDLDYATSWSYGWNELPNTLIPDYNGGASSGAINPDKSATVDLLKRAGQTNYRTVAKALPLYWGPQPFTAGPMYMGAITIFLFVLGLGLWKDKERWWLLIPTMIGILLGVGSHFMPFTEFWYYHMPFYSKFRTVSMALVILQITLPVLGFLILDRIVRGGVKKEEFLRWGVVALVVTGGFCLLSATGIGRSFTGGSDSQMQDVIVDALKEDRRMLLRQDALMSFFLIAVTFCLLWWSLLPKSMEDGRGRRLAAGLAVCALVLINMFAVGKRYLNADHFVKARTFNNQFAERPVDKKILSDPELSYRVLDLSTNVFNDSYCSYFHKSIGGYSPVKLQRYQDLIDRYIVSEINSVYGSLDGKKTFAEAEAALPEIPVLSMLNDKYIILNQDIAIRNRHALGEAWVVDSVATAATPDEEIALLGKVDLGTTMVLGPDFAEKAAALPAPADSVSRAIEMTSYAPNQITYTYDFAKPEAVVFSEIYYPRGWKAVLDGNPAGKTPTGTEIELFRADWTLRGAVLPAGKHILTMRFDPESYAVSSNISRASSAGLILLTLLSIAAALLPGKQELPRSGREQRS